MKIFNNSFTTLDMRLIVYSHSQTLRQDGGHEKTKSADRAGQRRRHADGRDLKVQKYYQTCFFNTEQFKGIDR